MNNLLKNFDFQRNQWNLSEFSVKDIWLEVQLLEMKIFENSDFLSKHFIF